MKVLVQWALANPQDWQEYDTSQFELIPKKPEPTGGEVINNTPGWIHAINIQGRVISGRDHYGIKPHAGGVTVCYWDDDPDDFPPGMFSAFECTIEEPAFDSRVGAVNARQWLTIYAQDKWLEENGHKWEGVRTVSGPVEIRPWSEFVPPSAQAHGVWVGDDLNDELRTLRSIRGWHEWITDPKSAIRRPNSTRYYTTNTTYGDVVHIFSEEREFSSTAGSGSTTEEIAKNKEERTHSWTTPSAPSQTDWSGNWSYSYDASSTGADINHGFKTLGAENGHICRSNTGSEQETHVFSNTNNGPGTFSESDVNLGFSASASASDILHACLVAQNTHTKDAQNMVINHGSTSYLDAPWTISSDREGQFSWAELELPTAPRQGHFSWAELELPTAPREGQFSWAEFEVSDAPREGQFSWAELEVPDTGRQGQFSWAELELPDAPRAAYVSWTELEIPTAPREGQFSWAELELPEAPREGQISWAELELPTAPRQGQISWTELELPAAPREGQISWAEFEVPSPGEGKSAYYWWLSARRKYLE